MNGLQVIDNREVLGKKFRVYGTIEEPLFLAKDIANWIEHNKPSEMIRNVDEDERIKIFINRGDTIAEVLQPNTEYWFLTEDGLYEVLMQSRKPIAKAFKKQVKQILKSLRLNQIEITTKNANDNQVNDLITTANNLIANVNGLITTANNLLLCAIDVTQNSQKETEFKSVETISKEKLDAVELEISNLENEFLTVQEFCRFLNSKNAIPKKLGCQTLYQLLRDNNIINYYNTPIKNEYFNIIDYKMYLNKQGMIFIYNLAKENIDVNYVVRHK